MTQKRAVFLLAGLLAACGGGNELQVKEKPPADTTPPTISNLAVSPATAAKGTQVTVTFSVDEELKRLVVLVAGRSAECTTSGNDSSCTYTMVGDESPGTQLVNVRAIDLAGNAGTAEASFTLDYGAPLLTITAQPPALSNQTTATVEFTSDDAAATFRCALDGAEAQACTSPYTTPTLAEGAHVVEIVATDALGNEASAKVAFTTDLTAPETLLVQGVPPLTREPSHVVLFRSNDFQARFECRLDEGQFQTCASPYTLDGFSEGEHDFSVRAVDEVGNADASPVTFSFVADRTAPVTTIDPLADTGAPTQTIVFTVSEANSTSVCSRDGAPFEACTSPVVLENLEDGDHTFDILSTDEAGNSEAVPVSIVFVVDTSAPSASIFAGPTPFTNDTTATLQFSSNEPGSTFKCSLDGAQLVDCTSPHVESNLAEGQHRFEVVATDRYGNVDPTPAAYNWTVDTTAPVPSFTSPFPPLVLQPNYTVAFSADESATWECSLDGSAFAPCQSPHTLTNLTDNVNSAEPSHVFAVRATDRAGNVSQELTATFDVNLSYPTPGVVKLIGPEATRTPNTTPTFAWYGDDCETYDFTLSTDPTFRDASKVVVELIDTTDESWTPATPLEPGRYYAKMRGKNLTGYGTDTVGDTVQIGLAGNGWTKLGRTPTSADIRAAACSSADRCVFVGASSELFRTTDGGKTFLLAASPVTSTIHAVSFLDEELAIAVGASGTILRSVNGGLSWARITAESTGATLPTSDLKGVAIADGLALAVGAGATLLKSTDDGLSWTKVPHAATTDMINAVQIVSSSLAVAIDDYGRILKSIDGGATWSAKFDIPGSFGYAISFFDELNGFATADGGKVYVTRDGGENWSQVTNPHTTGNVLSIRAISADSAILTQSVSSTSAYSNVRLVTVESESANWTEATRADGGAVRGFTLNGLGFAGENGFAVGNSGAIFNVSLAANALELEEPKGLGGLPPGTEEILSLHFVSANVGYMVGVGGLAFRTTDGGRNWIPMDIDPSIPDETNWYITFLDANNGWVVGYNDTEGFVSKTVDGGLTWTVMALPNPPEAMLGIDIKSPTLGYAVGTGDSVYMLDANGEWIEAPATGIADDLTSVRIASENEVYASSAFTYDVGRWDGTSWSLESPSPGWEYWPVLWVLGPDTVIAASDYGTIYKRTASGWYEVHDNFEYDPYWAVHFMDDLNGFAVGGYGGVYSTIDGGETWKQDYSFPSTSSMYAVWGFSPTDLLVGGASRALYRNGAFVR